MLDINVIDGHLVLPEVMAPDADVAAQMVRAGRADEVQIEIERREWLRSAEGREHMETIATQSAPMPAEERTAIEGRAAAKQAAETARHNRRAAKLRSAYPQHAAHFRYR